jgi:predicted transcriptional regulator
MPEACWERRDLDQGDQSVADRSCIEVQLALNTVEGVEIMRALDFGPLSLSDMSCRTGVDVLRLARAIRTLTTFGVLVRRSNGEYARTDLSAREAVAH